VDQVVGPVGVVGGSVMESKYPPHRSALRVDSKAPPGAAGTAVAVLASEKHREGTQ
jgi:hypothetical protein